MSPGTIRIGRAELMAVARMAVRLGVPIESLSSLAALLHPDVAERVIDAYWQKMARSQRSSPSTRLEMLRMARETGGLDQAALDRLDEIRATLEKYRQEGLTPKNLQLIRQVLTDGVWSEVVALPNVLMQEARGPRTTRRSRPPSQRSSLSQSRSSLSRPSGLAISSASSWVKT